MRSVLALLVLAACATEEPAAPSLPEPLDVIWEASIHRGDLVVLVPGTGSYDFLATSIEPLGPNPLVDVRAIEKVADDAIVFEQAIAAAHRAGLSNAELEAGAITFGLWGVGFTKISSFDYLSYEGIRIHIVVLGGKSSCAVGLVIANLLNYTPENALADGSDLYTKIQAWLATHGSGSPRNVIIASHSWGGAVAEYLGFHLADVEGRRGPLVDGTGVARIALTISAGVPGFVPGYAFAGPGLRHLSEGDLYEVDRPDDPVHAMNPSGNPDGHQYDILFGSAFQGSYGVTTTELSCRGVPGICHPRSP
ncbi:MAG: hypothetical protein JWO36_3304 [Myxococcales bacterium]|nr:hypothetical protein [Myxococcales bacterium]